jgi:hypothetical protein
MRRLFRILLTATTVLSVVLCVGLGVLWVRSYWVTDFVRASPGRPVFGFTHCYLVTGRGGIGVVAGSGTSGPGQAVMWRYRPATAYGNGGWDANGLGLWAGVSRVGGGNAFYGAIAPGWLLAAAAAVMPAARFITGRRRRRQAEPRGFDVQAPEGVNP